MQWICLALIALTHGLFGVNRTEFFQKTLDKLKSEEGYNIDQREIVADFVPIFVKKELLGVLFLLENGKVWLSDDGCDNKGVYLEKGNEVLFTPEGSIIYPLGISKRMAQDGEQWVMRQSVQYVGSFKNSKRVSKTVTDIKEGRTFFDDGASFALEDQIDTEAVENFRNNVGDFFMPSILKKVFLFEPLKIGDQVAVYEFELAKEIYELGFFRNQTLTWFEKTDKKDHISWHEPRIFSEALLQEVESRGIALSQKRTVVDSFPVMVSVNMPKQDEMVIESDLLLLDSSEMIHIQDDDDKVLSSPRFETGDELFLVESEFDETSRAIVPEQYRILKLEACFSCKKQEDFETSIKTITSINQDRYTFDDGSDLLFSELFQIPAHFSGSYYDDEWETTTYWDTTWNNLNGQVTIVIGCNDFYTKESLERFSRTFESGERIECKIFFSKELPNIFNSQSFQVGDTVSIYKMKGVSKPNESLLGLPEESCFMLMRKV